MKLRKIYLTALLASFACGTACWKSEVRADRVNRPTDARPVSSATPRIEEKEPVPEKDKNEPTEAKKPENTAKGQGFQAHLPSGFQMPTDVVGLKLLNEYGSICVAGGGAIAPQKIFFRDEAEVSAFQSSLRKSSENIGGFSLELQEPAMNALRKAIDEAGRAGAKITPRAADSARRSYTDTVKLWASRVEPGLAHWTGKGRITAADANRIKALAPFEQVPEILKLEAQGMYFSKDFSKSILYSVAAPGASQHLFMLSLDIEQYASSQVREILAKNGWFQTVQSDLPHFSYLGVEENQLPARGLKAVTMSGQKFWVPDLRAE